MNVVLSPFHQTLKFIMGRGSWERKQYECCVISVLQCYLYLDLLGPNTNIINFSLRF